MRFVLEDVFEQLWARRATALVALLGMAIGVAAIVAIVAIGAATAGAVGGIFGGLTDDEFFVHPDARQPQARRTFFGSADIDEIRAANSHIVAVFSSLRLNDVMSFEHRTTRVQFASAASGRFGTNDVLFGRFFTDEDIEASSSVVVLSRDTADALTDDPAGLIGQQVRIAAQSYRVVGVLSQPREGSFHYDFDASVHMPYTTFRARYVRGRRTAVQIMLDDPAALGEAKADVMALAKRLHPRSAYQAEDKGDITDSVAAIFSVVTGILVAVAAISTIVAGVGITSVMLASVVARTREIGLRRAIGAKRRHIISQFLLEALTLTTAGSLIGTCFGLLIGLAITYGPVAAISGVVSPIPWLKCVIYATVATVVVGVSFGVYPAARAARLDPARALSYEGS